MAFKRQGNKFTLILSFLCLLNVNVSACFAYPICVGTCVAACIAGEILLPPTGLPILEACMVYCPSFCAFPPMCISPETMITKLHPENQMSFIVPVNEIVPGDQVRTVAENGTMIWANVTQNIISSNARFCNNNNNYLEVNCDETDIK